MVFLSRTAFLVSDLFVVPARKLFNSFDFRPKQAKNWKGNSIGSKDCSAKSDSACSISTGFIVFGLGLESYMTSFSLGGPYSAYLPGFRPAVLGPLIRPISRPNVSSSYSSAILVLL